MGRYAVIDEPTGTVVNVIEWDGIAEWEQPEGCIVVESEEAQIGWGYAEGEFQEPPPIEIPPPAIAPAPEMLAFLLAEAAKVMAPLQDAVDIGEATPEEEATLVAWKRYRVALNRVDLTVAAPTWPTTPQAV